MEKSWYGYILHCFSIFAMLHKCPRVENLQLFSLIQIQKKKKNRFGGQKCDGSWQQIKFKKSRILHPKFVGFSLYHLEEVDTIEEEKS